MSERKSKNKTKAPTPLAMRAATAGRRGIRAPGEIEAARFEGEVASRDDAIALACRVLCDE